MDVHSLPANPSPPRGGRCLWVGSAGCVALAVGLALLIGVIILLVKFI